jgi:nucleotide sugar dehydrogenase
VSVTERPAGRRIVSAPSTTFSALGGTAPVPEVVCRHERPELVEPWTGEPGTAGTVAVVGAGKMGLTLAGQFVSHGWRVIAVDVDPRVVDSINAGQSHVMEPGLAEIVAGARAEGMLSATADAATATRDADVVVLIVPIKLDEAGTPDYSLMDAAVESIRGGVHAGQLVIFETTLPVGDTRGRYAPRLAAGGLKLEEELFVAFSPERLFSGAALRNLATYPKLVGGLGPASTDRAAAFYASVLDAEVVAMSSAEAAEFAKLAETTYRDVNIALANQFASYATSFDLDIREVIAAANSQPYSHIHQPGLGVGGHCIPVYPRFLLSRGAELPLVALGRQINDGQVDAAVEFLMRQLGDLREATVLVLGLTYRAGVKELAYSQGPELVQALRRAGARVYAFDPLLGDEEVRALGAAPYSWGDALRTDAILTQTDDRQWRTLDLRWFDGLTWLLDGRNSLGDLDLPAGVSYAGIGVPIRTGS